MRFLWQIVILLTFTTNTRPIDIGKHGTKIIMQEDIETIVITKPMQPMLHEILKARNDLTFAKKITMESITNQLKDKSNVKLRLSVLNSADISLQYLQQQLSDLKDSSKGKGSRMEKRALEILGDFLSKVTGVPSARDHRMVIEQLKAVRSENKGIETLLGQQNSENAKILRRLHFHESSFNAFQQSESSMNATIHGNTNEIQKAEALISTMAKVNLLLIRANDLLRDAANIMQSSDSDRLSRSCVSPPEISRYLTKIYQDRDDRSAPLFADNNLDFYYQEKLSHSWVDPNNFALTTLLQIPIAKMGKTSSVQILAPHEQLHGDFPLCVVDANRRILTQPQSVKKERSRSLIRNVRITIFVNPALGLLSTT